jgi:hypothetical protein
VVENLPHHHNVAGSCPAVAAAAELIQRMEKLLKAYFKHASLLSHWLITAAKSFMLSRKIFSRKYLNGFKKFSASDAMGK